MLNKKRGAIRVLFCVVSLTRVLDVAAQDLNLKGVANFRDIGGYPTGDGHRIKSGMVFRSGELSGLTPADQEILTPLNIRYEVDLRTDAERSAAPSHWGQKTPRVIAISVGMPRDGKALNDRMQQLSQIKTRDEAKTQMQQATAGIAIDGAPEIGKVLRELAKTSGHIRNSRTWYRRDHRLDNPPITRCSFPSNTVSRTVWHCCSATLTAR
jgi:hypothetical protein